MHVSAIARLQHPAIVTIHDYGNERGQFFLVMDLLEGENLVEHLRQMARAGKRYDLREILHVLSIVADGLGLAHRQGLTHQSLKPANIFLIPLKKAELPGEPLVRAVLTDMGLARLDNNPATEYDDMLPYLAPEQCLGDIGQDGRSEIYTLGTLLYQLSTGRLPFTTNNLHEAIKNHLHGEIPHPRTVHPDIPEAITDLILRATAKKPDHRFRTTEAMAQAMRVCLETLSPAECRDFAGTSVPLSLAAPIAANGTAPRLKNPFPVGQGNIHKDELILATNDSYPTVLPLYNDRYTLGRSKRNDIVIEDETVSNRHLKIAAIDGEWYFTDLQSTNGTYRGQLQLPTGKATPWKRGDILRIGAHYIQVHCISDPLPDVVIPQKVEQIKEEPVKKAARSHHNGTKILAHRPVKIEGEINLVVTPNVVELPVNGSVLCQIGLFNHSNGEDHFHLSLPDVPESWYTMPQSGLFLQSRGKGQLTIQLQLPPDERSGAGMMPLTIQVQGKNYSHLRNQTTIQLKIPVISALEVNLAPEKINNKEQTTLYLHNSGNAPVIFNILSEDKQNKLQFQYSTHQPPLTPGQKRKIPITIAAKDRYLIGDPRGLPFTFIVDAGKIQHRCQGQVATKPIIPTWAVPIIGMVLGLFLLSLIIGGLYLLTPLF